MDTPHARYHRQMLLPGFGPEAQDRLARAHAAIVGVGALGCAIADQLARAGVGRLTLIDRDIVELTNLQRQTLFSEADARDGTPKAEAAARRLAAINSQITLTPRIADLIPENAGSLLGIDNSSRPDVILDGTDNFETRYLLNDIAIRERIPFIYGGAVGTRGMQMNVIPTATPQGPCLRCIFEDPPAPGSAPTCDTAGVLGPLIAIIGAMEACEALKVLTGHAELPSPQLVELDPWLGVSRRLSVQRSPDCPCCVQRRFDFLDARSSDTASLCGQDAIQIRPAPGATLDLAALAGRLAQHGPFAAIGSMMVRGHLAAEPADAGGPIGLTLFADGRAIVRGTTRAERARSIYARYIGA